MRAIRNFMKIQYWSDLHLELKKNAEYIMQRRIDVVGDILILAGDITYWDDKQFAYPFFDKISEKFNKVFMIPGNHEFYNGFDISILECPVKINIRDNVYLVNNISESIDGVDILFTTLWSKIMPQNAVFIERNVNDFHLIKYKGETMTYKDFNQLYSQSYHFLDNAIKNSFSKKRIVVTHHCPTQMANAIEYRDSKLNNAFVIELDDFIYHSPVDYWIFGHTHRNVPMININGTKIVTNQLGYIDLLEHKNFDIKAFIEI